MDRSRSRPRTEGTMQKVQVLLQPTDMDTQACEREALTAGSRPGRSRSSCVTPTWGRPSLRALSSRPGSEPMSLVPKTASTQGAAFTIRSRSFWAMQPPTAMRVSGLCCLNLCQRPMVPYMRWVALSRTAQVLSTITSTSRARTCSGVACW